MSQVLSKQTYKFAIWILIGMGLYLLVVALSAVFHLLFQDITKIYVVTETGVVSLDIASYLIYATFELILFVIQTVVVVVLLFIVWFYNFLVVDVFFNGIGDWLNYAFFQSVQKVPESNVTLFANAIDILRLFFVGFVGDFFGSVSSGISDIFGGLSV